jgi:hypothetical protein
MAAENADLFFYPEKLFKNSCLVFFEYLHPVIDESAGVLYKPKKIRFPQEPDFK